MDQSINNKQLTTEEPTVNQPSKRDVDYLRCIFPVPFKVCGKKMKPLTIGHLLLFEKCKLIYRQSLRSATYDNTTLKDLVAGIMICSRDFISGSTLMLGSKYQARFWMWLLKLKLSYPEEIKKLKWYDRLAYRFIRKYDRFQEHANFIQYYVTHQSNFPDTYLDDKQKKYASTNTHGSPFLFVLINTLLKNYKLLSVDAVCDIPVDFAMWIIAVDSEQQGLTNIEIGENSDYKEVFDYIKNLKENPAEMTKFLSEATRK